VDSEKAITTNATIFVVGNNSYEPLDRTDYVANPDVTNSLSETKICLEGDNYCYYPLGLCDDQLTNGSEQTNDSYPSDDS
jgi:hypothetical protein